MPPMQTSALAIITLRREIADRYERINRLWLSARTNYRRLNDSPVQNLMALRDAAARLDQLAAGRAALLRDLKALSD
jgi:hypothetical protein